MTGPSVSAAYSISHEPRVYLALDFEVFVNLAEHDQYQFFTVSQFQSLLPPD